MPRRNRKNADLIRLDKQFLHWVELQRSAFSGLFSEWHDGVGYSIACHVRRAGQAGTGYKPLFSAIPLTNLEHQLTHQHGESALAPEEWFENMAARYLSFWLRTQPELVRQLVHEK